MFLFIALGSSPALNVSRMVAAVWGLLLMLTGVRGVLVCESRFFHLNSAAICHFSNPVVLMALTDLWHFILAIARVMLALIAFERQ
mgnify:CR=1 FL=1